jgi:exonuclease III
LRQDTLPCNYGGVLAAAPSGVRLTAIDLGLTLLTFEAVCVKVDVGPSLCIVLLIYRPESAANKSEFYRKFSDAVDHLATMSVAVVITGDINIPLDRPPDADASRLTSLLAARAC